MCFAAPSYSTATICPKMASKNALAPSKLKFKKNSRVGYVCIEESFDTIFNMGYGLGKWAMDMRVKIESLGSQAFAFLVVLKLQVPLGTPVITVVS